MPRPKPVDPNPNLEGLEDFAAKGARSAGGGAGIAMARETTGAGRRKERDLNDIPMSVQLRLTPRFLARIDRVIARNPGTSRHAWMIRAIENALEQEEPTRQR